MRRAGGAGLTRLVRDITSTPAKNLYLVTDVSVRDANRRNGFRLASAQVVTASLAR